MHEREFLMSALKVSRLLIRAQNVDFEAIAKCDGSDG